MGRGGPHNFYRRLLREDFLCSMLFLKVFAIKRSGLTARAGEGVMAYIYRDF